MNGLPKNRMSLLMFVPLLMLSTIVVSILHTELASAAWPKLGETFVVYRKGKTSFLYWNGKDKDWKILQSSGVPRVWLDGKACTKNSGSANENGNATKNVIDDNATFNNCTGLEITAKDNESWFKEANLAIQIGDFDSKETVKIDGGIIKESGSKSDVSIAKDEKSGKSKSSGCSGGNPNRKQECSILVVFEYRHGNSFKIDLDNEWNGAGKKGSSGHEFWYDGMEFDDYRTLTFNPNGGSVFDNQVQSDGTIGDEATLWSHRDSTNKIVLREYIKGKTPNEFPTPTRSNYVFKGWYTAASGGVLVCSGPIVSTSCGLPGLSPINSDVDLYAQWAPVIDWDLSGAIPMTSAGGVSGAISSGTAISNGASVIPGQRITFTYKLSNAGPTSATGVGGSATTQYLNNYRTGTATPDATSYSNKTVPTSGIEPVTAQTITVPIDAENGWKICKTLSWSPDTDSGGTGSVQACVTVSVVNVPQCGITNFAGTGAILADGLSRQFTITASGTLTRPTKIQATITTPTNTLPAVTKEGSALPQGGNDKESKGTFEFVPLSSNPGEYKLTWTVDGKSGDTCKSAVIAGNRPYFQISGGDVLAGATSGDAAKVASWNGGEDKSYAGANNNLAVIATGSIDGVRTGKGSSDKPNYLSFATTRQANDFGGRFQDIPDVDYSTPETNGTLLAGSADLGILEDGKTYRAEVGNLTISASSAMTNGKKVTIVAAGNVYISQNITYNYTNISQIPRLTIYAKNIIIGSGVAEIRGIFHAISDGSGGGNFYSCGSSTKGYDYTLDVDLIKSSCGTSLKVYGSVSANRLILTRTAGSWHNNGAAAEEFLHGPEAWLTAPMPTNTFDHYVSLPPVL